MARVKVPFSGITSHSNSADGECKNIVNLRPKNGFLKPVPPRKIIQELSSEYDIVFVHRGNDYENWIGVTQQDVYFISGSTSTFLFSIPDLYRNNGTTYGDNAVKSIQQIGNTLSFITEDNVYYALWNSNSYKYLGEIPDIPSVSFSTPAMTTVSKTYHSEYVDGVTPENMFDATKGLINIMVEDNKSKFSDAFLIRWAFRLYDGKTIKTSSPILVMPRDYYRNWGMAKITPRPFTTLDNTANIKLKFFTLQVIYDFTSLSGWQDIIKSVDFFATNYVGLSGSGSVQNYFWQLVDVNGDSNIYYPYGRVVERYSPDKSLFEHTEKTPEEKVTDASQFYLYYRDDDFSTSKTVTFPNNKTTVKEAFSNIIYQELLENDPFTHHAYGANSSTVYNNRLRLLGIKTTFFDGFPLDHFSWGSNYNGGTYVPGTKQYYVNVKLKLPDGGGEVQIIRDVKYFLNAFISYPDPRAYEMDIYILANNPSPPPSYRFEKHLSIKLIPHPTLNIAYYINEDLLPIIPSMIELYYFFPDITEKTLIMEQNKIKVSEVDNPFIFPNVNTYLIGSGEILAESSIIMNVSDRNYGMFPVFVFTTDGIFTMAGQTSEEVHDSIQAPTYLEPPTTGVICATPYGVAFMTKRGLMMISNDGTIFLSPQLRETDDILNIDLTAIGNQLTDYPSMPFTSFLNVVTDMVYNPYHDELILAAKTLPYCYVYDFPSKSFYLSTEKIDQVVQNTFPDVYVVAGTTLKDISDYESTTADISVITRPLQFGTTDIKKLERIFLRALMHNAQGMSVVGFHSLDGVNFSPIKGFTFGTGENYKDFDLGLLARETYRQYIFLLTGTVDEQSQIQYVEYEIDKDYNNGKMR